MKELIVTLKQHTPMIHFQHYQENATLRASEVKPKLDRYILEILGRNDSENKYKKGCEIAKKNGWIIGENALNYKLRITPLSKVDVFDINPLNEKGKRIPFPAYFANMNADFDDEMKFKRFSFCEKLELRFLFINRSNNIDNSLELKELYDYISQPALLASFFLKTNFGARSSKGFGSFFIDEEDDLYISPESNYQFKIRINDKNPYNKFKKLFTQIDLFYRSLRSGINEKNRNETAFYFKSLLYKYCTDVLNKDWDKKRIKEFYINNITTNNNCIDIKDVLGFSTNEHWYSYNYKIKKSIIPNSQLKPQRMQSPILFKPIEDGEYFYIYILFMPMKVALKDFLSSGQVLVENGNLPNLILDLPTNFSLKKFFNYIFDEQELNFDIREHVEERYHNNNTFRILENIYDQLKKDI